jgi:hypothetical protein
MTRDGAVAARMAHNHEVPGSSPGPATRVNQSYPSKRVVFIYFGIEDAMRLDPKRFANSHQSELYDEPDSSYPFK